MTEINTETISSYLSGRLAEGDVTVTDLVEHVEGWSRDTVSFTASWMENGEQVEDRLVIRAESAEQSNADLQLYGEIETEFHAMEAAQSASLPVPETHWYESDTSHLDARFFLVEHIPGEAPITWSPKWRSRLYDAWDADGRSLPHQFVDTAAGVHSIDPANVEGVTDVHPDEIPVREIERWESLYRETVLIEEPLMEEALEWLKDNKPTVDETTLVHGDFRIGNMLIDDGDEIMGVLDWEFARAGDPLFDIGYASMDYYAGKLLTETERPELACSLVDRDWFYKEYERRTGRSISSERVKFWRVLSIFLVITMCVGGMHRYHEGRSDDVRNVWFQYMLPGLRESLLRHIRKDRI
ncbi:phosphotransferase family protein [Natrinema gelatinilyticum]|uniref:phosphotransferase family protein n=1 Tax=Natrinema gelatinilyticum TaxID=2961571 RepID=UPI0020C4A34A|nr:phosphotransferase family protein [Natrinema gelatinilyticum]